MIFRQFRIDFDLNTSGHTFRVVSTTSVESGLRVASYASLPVSADRSEVIHPSAPHIKARWRLEKPSAATVSIYVRDMKIYFPDGLGDSLASSCLLVSGLDREADARAIDEFAFSSDIDLAEDQILYGLLTHAPAVASLWSGRQGELDLFEEEDRNRVAEMEGCLAATFFEGLFPDRNERPN